MSTPRRAGLLAAILYLQLASHGVAAAREDLVAPPEPSGYWMGPSRGDTPKGIAGGLTLDVHGLDRLMAAGSPLLVDVGPQETRPAGLDPARPWMPTHRTVPGAVWLPGAGVGDLSAQGQTVLAARLATLTRGDKNRPIVGFCHARCWASWNAARRMIALGYRNVYWFPGGMEAWQDRHASATATPDALWMEQSGSSVK